MNLIATVMLALVTSCAGCQKSAGQDPTPKPAPKYEVVCRLTGANLEGLGAQVDTYIQPDQQVQFHVATYSVPDNGQVEYATVGSPPDKAEFTLLVRFAAVTRTSSLRPKSNSKLTAEVLVNGKVKTTAIIDNTTQFGGADYLYAVAKFKIGE